MSKKYYVSGNTAEGFINFLPKNVKDFNQIIILRHPSYTLKTTIINNIINKYESDVEILLSALGAKYLDGVIIREKSLAVIIDRIASPDGAAIELDLNLFTKEELPKSETFAKAEADFHTFTQAAYGNFETGLKIHDDLEAIYIKEMDFDRADQLAEEFIEKLLRDVPKQAKTSLVQQRLFGTNTADGVVNEVPHILQQISKTYFIKGRAGTGKSTFMKKIMRACESHGFNIELYHCSFDPNSIDMVLVRELDFCIFDSTDPHEFFPERDGEVVIDLYEKAVTPGTDEKFAEEINELNNFYKSHMKKGIQNLKKAGEHLETVEQQYNFEEEEVNNIIDFITGKVVH